LRPALEIKEEYEWRVVETTEEEEKKEERG